MTDVTALEIISEQNWDQRVALMRKVINDYKSQGNEEGVKRATGKLKELVNSLKNEIVILNNF